MKKNYNFQKDEKIIVSEKNKLHQITVAEIETIYSESGISTINKSDKNKLVFAKNLLFFEKELKDFGFVKANRNEIVNCAYILNINLKTKQVELCNNNIINISRRNLNNFKNIFQNN